MSQLQLNHNTIYLGSRRGPPSPIPSPYPQCSFFLFFAFRLITSRVLRGLRAPVSRVLSVKMDGMGEILPPETGVQAGPAPMPAAMSQYNLLSTAFKAPEFIHTFGALTDRTVLDYFAQSPFFDRQSTNQMLRMQAVELVPVGRWTSAEEADKLRAFVGIEYIVAHSSPPNLFVIHRRYRSSPQEAHVQAAYFVLNDAIMQSPELFTILDNRLVRLTFLSLSDS